VRYRKSLKIAVFIAWLAAWPIAIQLSDEHFPELGPVTFAWLVFLVICVQVLRSWVIGGALLGIVAAAAVTFVRPESESSRPGIFMLCLVVGILGAWGCQVVVGSRKPPV
jgi:hypothetical protein